ncbi:MAG: hypothetical protein FWD31_05900 [Planctomycetaceae bacterium]|nr:hypothetical protein [Planctomycetaceae bacterium]
MGGRSHRDHTERVRAVFYYCAAVHENQEAGLDDRGGISPECPRSKQDGRACCRRQVVTADQEAGLDGRGANSAGMS